MVCVLIWSWFNKSVQFVNTYHVIHMICASFKMYVILVNKVYWETRGYIYAPRRHVIINRLTERYEPCPTHILLTKWYPRDWIWSQAEETNWEEIKIPNQLGWKSPISATPFGEQPQLSHLFHFSLFPSLALLHRNSVGERQHTLDSPRPELCFLTTSPSQDAKSNKKLSGKAVPGRPPLKTRGKWRQMTHVSTKTLCEVNKCEDIGKHVLFVSKKLKALSFTLLSIKVSQWFHLQIYITLMTLMSCLWTIKSRFKNSEVQEAWGFIRIIWMCP